MTQQEALVKLGRLNPKEAAVVREYYQVEGDNRAAFVLNSEQRRQTLQRAFRKLAAK